jgi:hypothetical protein
MRVRIIRDKDRQETVGTVVTAHPYLDRWAGKWVKVDDTERCYTLTEGVEYADLYFAVVVGFCAECDGDAEVDDYLCGLCRKKWKSLTGDELP